jgi:hypothetical protein
VKNARCGRPFPGTSALKQLRQTPRKAHRRMGQS